MLKNAQPDEPLSARLAQLSQRLNAARSFAEPRPSSHVPVLGPLINWLRRFAGGLATRWYVSPMMEQQSRFNEQVTAAFDELAQVAVAQERQLRKPKAPPYLASPLQSQNPTAPDNLEALFRLSPEALREWEMADIPEDVGTCGEAPLAATYDENLVIRDPFSWHQQIGWRYMFNLAVLGPALRCRPGDTVLDFAGGSGWVAEFMDRFGFRTVLFDCAEAVLRGGRLRFAADKRLQQYVRMDPVLGDGMQLPFADESFDGIVCMNAFHHMPSFEATLREMARVLKPGCRAVFGEPGEEHARNALAQQMMHEHGIFEKNVPLDLVYVYARRSGFAQMLRYPFVYPEMMELPFPEQGRSAATVQEHLGQVLPGFLTGLSLFVLQKAGERVLDSNASLTELDRHPLRAEITLLQSTPEASAGAVLVDRLRVKNTGDVLWLSAEKPMGGFVRLGLKLSDAVGRVLEKGLERPFLPHDVAPGEEVELDVPIRAPATPGQYVIKYDMVDEFRIWFEACGSRPVERTLVVV